VCLILAITMQTVMSSLEVSRTTTYVNVCSPHTIQETPTCHHHKQGNPKSIPRHNVILCGPCFDRYEFFALSKKNSIIFVNFLSYCLRRNSLLWVSMVFQMWWVFIRLMARIISSGASTFRGLFKDSQL